MSEPLSDAELIQLVQEKLPEELSAEEIERLRERLRESSELREVLLDQLQWETYLGEALGRFQVSVDDIVNRGGPPYNRISRYWNWRFLLLFAIGLVSVLLVAVISPQAEPLPPEAAPPQAIAAEGKNDRTPEPIRVDVTTENPATPAAVRTAVAAAEASRSDSASMTATVAETSAEPAKPATAAAEPDEPWSDALRPEAEVLSVAEGVFAPLKMHEGIVQAELNRWFEPVEGQPHRFQEAKRANVPVAGFEGIVRLRAPVRAGTALRLSLLEHHGLRLHFWNGREGVTLQYYHRPRPLWAAYRGERTENEVQPSHIALIGTDDGRYERTWSGPVELRYQAGTLILSRGDIRLLTVPFGDPPGEVYFDGRAWFRGIALYRSEPLPSLPENPHPFALRSLKPALMSWQQELPAEANVNKSPGGQIELVAEKLTQTAWISIPVPEAGLYEVILQVEQPSPGTGVYLGDQEGKPLHRVGFFRERRTGWTSFGFLPPDSLSVVSSLDVNVAPAPFTGTRQWLRLVLGHGSFKCWTSGDGESWGRAFEPARRLRGGFASVGLYCLPGEERRSITLRRLEIRELAGITGLVPEELRGKVLQLSGDLPVEQWVQAVLESEPAGVDPVVWRRACALRTLSSGAWGELGRVLLAGMSAEVLASPLPLEGRLRYLEDLALFADTWEPPEATHFAQWFTELGDQLVQEGHPQPYTVVSRAMMSSPLWTVAPLQTMPERFVREELLALLYAEQWENAWNLCQQLRFWNTSSFPEVQWPGGRDGVKRLLEWSESLAARALPERRSGQTAMPVHWRHPLVEEVSKEGYNVLAEFEAALDGQAYKDACQIIAASGSSGTLGLLPDAQDRQLMVSLPRAVALAMRAHPELQRTMDENFGPIGLLRVRQAAAEADVAAMQVATVQFTGTDAASAAHVWLGDRALAGGDFAHAVGHYFQSLRGASAIRQAEIQAKLRLAHAMLGQSYGEPAETDIELGGRRIVAAEFEQLIADLRESRRRTTSLSARPVAGIEGAESAVPAPAAYSVGRRWTFEGALGAHTGNHPPGIDQIGREYAATHAGDLLVVSNRFAVDVFDLAKGQRKWTRSIEKDRGDARSWAMRSMRPVVWGDRVFVRRLTRQGPEIAALELETGKELWTARPGDHVASEPLLVQDELYALVASPLQFGTMQVSLVSLDPLTGEQLAMQELIELRDAWGRQVPCNAVTIADKIVANIGGSVVCCDLLGQPRWLRREIWLPPSQEPDWTQQQQQAPVIAEGRVYIHQPGVLAIDCLDLESGRRHWQKVMPDVRRILGVAGQNVIVETSNGIRALGADDGSFAWRFNEDELLEARLCGGGERILLSCTRPLGEKIRQPSLLWLDAASGRELGQAPLEELADQQPRLGPLLVVDDRLWCGFGRGKDAKREFVELVPQGEAAPGTPPHRGLRHWLTHVDDPLQELVSTTLPGWLILVPQRGKEARYRDEFAGKPDLLVTQTTPAHTVAFARRLELPADSRARLHLKVASKPKEPWQLVVRANEATLLSETIQTPEGDHWQDHSIDLSPLAGKGAWLVVSQVRTGEKPVTAGWKELRMTME